MLQDKRGGKGKKKLRSLCNYSPLRTSRMGFICLAK